MSQNHRNIYCSSAKLVKERIEQNNPWYTANQFEWSQKPAIKRVYQRRYEFFIECIERTRKRLGSSLRLLDIGCGDGYWLNRLKDIPRLELMGIDYNPLRAKRSRELLPNVPVECIDISDFETEESFDVILLSQVIEHVSNDTEIIRKIRTLLQPSGVLILGAPNEGSFFQKRQLRRQGLGNTDHIHFYTEQKIRKKITDAGFSIENVLREVFYFFSDWLYYRLLHYQSGFDFLTFLSKVFPGQCSDYYFECIAPVV